MDEVSSSGIFPKEKAQQEKKKSKAFMENSRLTCPKRDALVKLED